MNDDEKVTHRHMLSGARAREISPRKLQLQSRAYELYTRDFLSYEQVGEMLSISRRVASEYVRAEMARRPDEDPEGVALERQRQVALCNRLIAKNFALIGTSQATGRESQYAVMASERIAKLLGLDSPIRVRDESPPMPLIGGVDKDAITKLLRLAIAAKPTSQRTEDDL